MDENNQVQFLEKGGVYWLQSSVATSLHAEYSWAQGSLLSDQETTLVASFKAEKRRRDWLLGRYTAKHLVQQVVREKTGQLPPLTSFSVLGRPDGSPEVVWKEQPDNFACTISISHSADVAFCALIERADWPLGADVERVDRRIMSFINDYLTAAEHELIEQTVEGWRPLHSTAIWSAKEAALKALRVGLRQDTRTLSCLVAPVAAPPDDWTPFIIQWEAGVKERPLTGWWRIEDNFILAMAVQTKPI
jgi:4'-phosphopantetheinyl transferase